MREIQQPTAFEAPQWAILPDPRGAQRYANVDNLMEMNIGGAVYHLAIAVPSELFTFLREVVRADRYDTVTLAIDKIGERYAFSILVADQLFDLWTYSDRSLPAWMRDRSRAITGD